MFAVCSSWFEIDERKWTYYHHGSHNDWELGAKTTTVPTSKVLVSEWHCIVSCKTPQWQPCLSSDFLITSVSSYFVSVCLRNHTSSMGPEMLWYPEHGFAEPLPLTIPCVIFLRLFVYIMWSIDTWRSAVHLAEVTRFLCVNSEGITNAWQGERFENLFPLKHGPANLCDSRVRSFHLCGRWLSGFYTDGVEPSPQLVPLYYHSCASILAFTPLAAPFSHVASVSGSWQALP